MLQAHIPLIQQFRAIEFAHLPSDTDLDFCNSTVDQCQYIVSEKGLLEIDIQNIDVTSIWDRVD